jgi:ParB-like chromosome segregation protein Spo0J
MAIAVAPADVSSHAADPRKLGLAAELKLQDWHLEYDYVEDFNLDEIRIADWAQVRDEASLSDRATLEEFRTQMREGATYPPITIMAPDILIDGNHRYRAARSLRWPTFPAFIAQFQTVDMAKAFSGAMNQLNGRRLSNEEAYRDALVMFEMGLSDEAVARELGRSRTTVRQMRGRKEFQQRAETLGLQEKAERIKQPQQAKMAAITHNPVFARAVEIAAETGGKPKIIDELVHTAKQAPSDSEAIDALESLRSNLAPAGPPPVRVTLPSEVRTARMQLGGLLKHETTPIKLLDQATPEDRAKSIDQWRRVRDLANAVLGLYNEQ